MLQFASICLKYQRKNLNPYSNFKHFLKPRSFLVSHCSHSEAKLYICFVIVPFLICLIISAFLFFTVKYLSFLLDGLFTILLFLVQKTLPPTVVDVQLHFILVWQKSMFHRVTRTPPDIAPPHYLRTLL